jgi:hypothetical protein
MEIAKIVGLLTFRNAVGVYHRGLMLQCGDFPRLRAAQALWRNRSDMLG